jgi:hypothetical protein
LSKRNRTVLRLASNRILFPIGMPPCPSPLPDSLPTIRKTRACCACDLSEFLGRAGVSLVKAGATAALGSFFAAAFTAVGLFLMGTTALPVILAIAAVVAGFIAAAYVVDMNDNHFEIKENVAKWAN